MIVQPMDDEIGVEDTQYIYYRQPNGFIDAAPVGKGQLQMFKYQREGWEPLQAYGGFAWQPYSCEAPLEALFQRDGAKEVSLKQIVANGWHLRPPKVPDCDGFRKGHAKHKRRCWARAQTVVFPQIAGQDLPPAATCDFCDDDGFFPNPKARDQHIRVMHKDELAQLRAGDAMSKAVLAALGRMGVQPQAYACGLCQDTFAGPVELEAHVGLHTAELVATKKK